MKKYRTPAGNVRSETDLIAKYGQDRFDELVKEGTLELVLGDDTEKKNPNDTSDSNSETEVTESTTETTLADSFSDSSSPLYQNNSLFTTPAGNEYTQEELIGKYGNQFYDLVSDGQLSFTGNQRAETEEEEVSFANLNIPDAPNRTGVLTNEDGSESTHKMKTETDGKGNWFSFPTVFQNPDGSFTDMSEQAEEDWKPVFEEAQKRGEVINFGNDKDSAIAYGEGSWKSSFNNKKNREILDSVGYFDVLEENKNNDYVSFVIDPKTGEMKYLSPWEQSEQDTDKRTFFIKDENGNTISKKGSELDKKVLEAIITYEKSQLPEYVEVSDMGIINNSLKDIELTEEEIEQLGGVDASILAKANITPLDYAKWVKANTRKEGSVYRFFKTLAASDEGDEFEKEKQQFERIQSYKANLLNDITKELTRLESLENYTDDPAELDKIRKAKTKLQDAFLDTAVEMRNVVDLFPKYKELTKEKDLRDRRRLYLAAKEGGGQEVSVGLMELGATAGNTIATFAADFFASIPGFFDQRLFQKGYDKKGLFAGISEMISDSADHLELDTGAVKRSAFVQGKPVFYNGEKFIVDRNGQVIDGNTNVRMEGILSEAEIAEIVLRSKDVPNEEINWTGGSVLQGGVQTLANLVALIRAGGKTTKSLGLKGPRAGNYGMGISSYMSSLTGSVEDVYDQLVASGMSEQEALDISINAGNAIASLDGIFSGLAGSNEKLLTGLTGVKQQIINLAKTKGKDFSQKELKQKGFELLKENAKELFIEELPVLFSERGINYLVNESIGKDVLNANITKSDIIETAVMTVGATSTLGSRKLLSGNKRKDFVRLVAKDVDNLTEVLNDLVVNKELTKEQAYNTYNEVYSMQAAELKTKGTIKMSKNVEQAADLLTQRQKLMDQREGLEGPLKEDIDRRIADVDAQLNTLAKNDLQEAQDIIDGKVDATSETEIVIEDDVAIESLKKDGIKNPTDKQIADKKLQLIQEQDAIQKQKTGNISQNQQSEVGTEVEQEVRKSPEQEAKTEIDLLTETEQPSLEQEGEMSVNTERVDAIVDDIIKKTEGRNKRRGNKDNRISEQENALNYLNQSTVFNEQMNDTEREAAVQRLNEKLGLQIPSPTKKQIDTKKRKKIKVDEVAALKDQIRLEAKAARDAKKDQDSRRKALYNSIRNLRKVGNISLTKAKALIKQVSTVNLNNTKKVQGVLDYINNAMNTAEYESKLKKAQSLQKQIKKDARGKEATLSDAALQFAKVNPKQVTDIDTYLEKAQSIKDGLKKTKTTKKGLQTSKPFDVKNIDNYSKKEIDRQKKANYELAKESFQELTGMDPKNLTLEEIREALYEVEGKQMSPEAKAELEKKKEKEVDKALNNAIKNVKVNIKGDIESGDIKLSKRNKQLVRDFLNMDLSLLTTAQKMAALDSIMNFEMNQSTGGMQSILSQYRGNKGMVDLKKQKIKSVENSTWVGRFWNKYISTLPNAFDLMFKSQAKGAKVMKALGLQDLVNGANKARTEAKRAESDYADAFKNKKMQNGKYFDAKNNTERGVLAEVRRVAPGTEAEQQAEFEKSKNLVKETYERLLESKDPDNVKKGELIKESYDKLLADSKTINEVEAKADPTNLEGVNYITEMWANKYEDLADTSLNVYNRNLGQDINYTPRNVIRVNPEESTRDITEPMFNPEGNRRSAYDKEAGILKEATKPKSLPKNRILNLDFDRQNLNNYEAALTDIFTAPSIQQIKGARESEAYNEVFPNDQSRKILDDRINAYVDKKRGIGEYNKEDSAVLGAVDKIATFGVVRALGGITQPFKQMIPIFNTLTNAGAVNTFLGSKLVFDPVVSKALDNSGMPIANRGVQSQADLNSLNSQIENDTRIGDEKGVINKTKKAGKKVVDGFDKANKYILQKTLVDPDVGTARASFIAYYIQAEGKRGVPPSEIDWSKPLNQSSLDFAQQQVDRQQNASDQDLQGGAFTSNNLTTSVIRKTLLPFSNFLLNQKTRMYADINTLINNPTALPGDKARAAKSLAGLGVETTMFNALGLGISSMLSKLAEGFTGEDEDDMRPDWEKRMAAREKEDKRLQNQIKGRVGNVVADIISPLPPLNDPLLNSANYFLNIVQEGDENPWKFFGNTDKELVDQLGVLGIGGKKLTTLKDMIMTAQTGEYTNRYGKKSKISKSAQDKLNTTAIIYALHLMNFLPLSEFGYMSERVFRDLKKMKPIEPPKAEEPEPRKTLRDKGPLNQKTKLQSNKLKVKSKL